MWSRLSPIAVIVIAAAALGACGGDETQPSTTTTPSTTVVSTTTSPVTPVTVPDDVCARLEDPGITAAAEAAELQREMYGEYFDRVGIDPIPPDDAFAMTSALRGTVAEECSEFLADVDLGADVDGVRAAAGR
jgi:hypothetical protein